MYCDKIMIYYSYTGLLTAALSILLTNQIALTGYADFQLNKTDHLTLKMATAEIVEMSVASNSASQYSSHQVIIFIQGMLLLGSTHFLGDVLNLTGAICLLLVFLYLLHYALIKKAQELGVIPK